MRAGTDARLRLADPPDLADALAEALAGGAPVAPVPPDPADRDRLLAVLDPHRPIAEPDAALLLPTSGSTGEPKAAVLSRAAIRASVAATHGRLGGPGEWLLALPVQHVAGAMVLARGLLAGIPVRPVGGQLSGLAGLPPASGRRYLSLVPTQLVRALREPELADALSRLDAVLLGGGAAPATLLDRARQAGVRVVRSYGMTETCGGCVYDGRPLDGVQVRLGDGGRVEIAGPVLFSGYRGRPAPTSTALRDGWLRTADRGAWDGDRLRVLGRFDDVVVTGGLKVELGPVDRAVAAWAADRGGDGIAVAVPDPEWGTAIVAVTDVPGGLGDLRAFVRQGLPAEAAPRRLVRLDALPRLSSGKPDRLRIAELAARRPEALR